MGGKQSRKTNLKTYKFKCPRCKSINRISTNHPYCQGCNWDSLKDLTSTKNSQFEEKLKKGMRK
ncbi:MAG: hypothetical protein WC635_02930 [Bacteriovorax sp.]|jgi:phage FluMu protein Com